MNSEVQNMTDEQFETYNKLLELVEEILEIPEIPDEKKSDFKKRKNDILLKK